MLRTRIPSLTIKEMKYIGYASRWISELSTQPLGNMVPVLRTGTSGTRSGGLRKGQSTCELLWGLSGFLSRRCQGLRSCMESVPEPEHSSPVQTWILGYFWSLPRGVSPRLERGHARALSSRAVAAVSRFPSRGSRDLWLSLEAFPRGFQKRLSHEAFP